MLILFDQATPVPIRPYLERHTVRTAAQQGWDKLSNGELLSAAEQAGSWPDRITDEEIEDAQAKGWRRLRAEMAKRDLAFQSLYHEGNPKALRDLQVLAAIHLLGGESSFERILAIVNGWLGRDDKPRFIYAILDRLESAGTITSRFADSFDAGANAERLFTLIRPISARYMHKKEIDAYEKENPDL